MSDETLTPVQGSKGIANRLVNDLCRPKRRPSLPPRWASPTRGRVREDHALSAALNLFGDTLSFSERNLAMRASRALGHWATRLRSATALLSGIFESQSCSKSHPVKARLRGDASPVMGSW
jgi:hypothetical protein